MDLSRVNMDILRAPSSSVKTAEEARWIISALEEEFRRHTNIIGLAAPQIGISRQISIVRAPGISIDLINPVILSVEEPMDSVEGCMSFPGRRWRVGRHGTVTVEYDRIWMPEGSWSVASPPSSLPKMDGDPLVRSVACYVHSQPESVMGGVVCMAVQHEIQHLAGVCLPWEEGSVEMPYIADEVNPLPKVGRNDPCPCGSGKKYKKCHGR